MKRSGPIKRTKPIRARNPKRRPAAAATAQREAVMTPKASSLNPDESSIALGDGSTAVVGDDVFGYRLNPDRIERHTVVKIADGGLYFTGALTAVNAECFYPSFERARRALEEFLDRKRASIRRDLAAAEERVSMARALRPESQVQS